MAIIKRLQGSEKRLQYMACFLIPEQESEQLKLLKTPYRLCASEASDIKEEELRSWLVEIRGTRGDTISGRVCVYRRSADQLEIAVKKLR